MPGVRVGEACGMRQPYGALGGAALLKDLALLALRCDSKAAQRRTHSKTLREVGRRSCWRSLWSAPALWRFNVRRVQTSVLHVTSSIPSLGHELGRFAGKLRPVGRLQDPGGDQR